MIKFNIKSLLRYLRKYYFYIPISTNAKNVIIPSNKFIILWIYNLGPNAIILIIISQINIYVTKSFNLLELDKMIFNINFF